MLSQIKHVDFYAYGTKEDMDLIIDQMNSLFSSQFSKLPKSEVFRTWGCGEDSCSCVLVVLFFSVVVHLLFSKDSVQLHTLLLQKHVSMMPSRWKWTRSRITKYSRTMAKPNMILNQMDHQCPSRLLEDQGTPSFACKHDGHHKAQLVAAGNLTPDPIDSIYSGVVQLGHQGYQSS